MINCTILQGRLTAEPEIKNAGETKVCNFTVANSKTYKDKEKKVFLRCVAWGNTAEFIGKYFKKGQEIAVKGSLETREWKDNDGNNRSSTELYIEEVSFCGSKSETSVNENTTTDVAADDEDLPF
jgi:single-strand DNA-binding protein